MTVWAAILIVAGVWSTMEGAIAEFESHPNIEVCS